MNVATAASPAAGTAGGCCTVTATVPGVEVAHLRVGGGGAWELAWHGGGTDGGIECPHPLPGWRAGDRRPDHALRAAAAVCTVVAAGGGYDWLPRWCFGADVFTGRAP